jgi:hypothetical protein
VIEFTEDAVVVSFSCGQYLFPPGVLYRVGEKQHGFNLGDSIEWVTQDSFKTVVPSGAVGIITGAKLEKLIVDFGTKQHFLDASDLRLLPTAGT